MADLLRVTDAGLYCEAGDFYVDPWRPVPRAVITHAHGDHAVRGCGRYLTSTAGRGVLASRMDFGAVIDGVSYGAPQSIGGVTVSLHPAGHILGSSQVRVEHRGEVWVISGDYKLSPDATCTAFEPVRCDTFVTECTFGLPIYRWPAQERVFGEVNDWWQANREAGRVSVLMAYALGKAQRLLAGVDPSIGPIYCHGAVERMNREYRTAGVPLPETQYSGGWRASDDPRGALVVAPPSVQGTSWLRKFGASSVAFASGWMQVRGTRRRRAVDRGFVVSDHADWNELLRAIRETEATRVLATHGRTGPMVRWLREAGLDAAALRTEYVGERDDADVDAGEADVVDESPGVAAEAQA
jgi:putative mRNA 3-end processing factor